MSIPASLFEEDYRECADPFQYEGNQFELVKYYAQLALLTDRRYLDGLELGPSIGIFTALLAPRCERLLAVDCSPSAIERVRRRCAELPNVATSVATVPSEFPEGTFDLITFAEFGYYLDGEDLAALRERISQAARPGGHLILCHMTIALDPYQDCELPSTWEQVHEPFRTDARWWHAARLNGKDVEEPAAGSLYVCDLFERV